MPAIQKKVARSSFDEIEASIDAEYRAIKKAVSDLRHLPIPPHSKQRIFDIALSIEKAASDWQRRCSESAYFRDALPLATLQLESAGYRSAGARKAQESKRRKKAAAAVERKTKDDARYEKAIKLFGEYRKQHPEDDADTAYSQMSKDLGISLRKLQDLLARARKEERISKHWRTPTAQK